MAVDVKKCRDGALRLLQKYGIKDPPVDVFDIIRSEGLQLVYFNPAQGHKDVSGLLDTDTRALYINLNDPPERQTFTVAHELAHYLLGHKADEYGVYKRQSLYAAHKQPKEKEADIFAAELLMPRGLLEAKMKHYKLGPADTLVLAKIFGVSQAAMTYRLKNIGLKNK